jgi:hypothetical protein
MPGSGAKMLSCPVLKQFAVLSSRALALSQGGRCRGANLRSGRSMQGEAERLQQFARTSTTINSHERRLSRCDCPGDEPEYEISLAELRHASFTIFSCRIVLAEEGPFEWYYPIKTPQQKIRTIRPLSARNSPQSSEGQGGELCPQLIKSTSGSASA